jgi:hypothetical protein
MFIFLVLHIVIQQCAKRSFVEGIVIGTKSIAPPVLKYNKKRYFLAQRTQRQHKGHKDETLTRLHIQNKKKPRHIALSKSRLCVLCAAFAFFVLIFSL